jgi:CPA2 family monovalent cation:H+ antiporter-2
VLFFVAIGTLIDPTALGRGLGWVAFVVGLVVVAKVVTAYVFARAARLRANPLQLAVGLGQVGEFSFVLASVGLAYGVVPPEVYAAVLTSVAITIVASTVLVRLVGGPRADTPAPAPAGG